MKSGRFIGVMSGTSLDGVDVVLATIDEHRVAQLASLSWPIPVSLKQAVPVSYTHLTLPTNSRV